jgi:hypothetical protein
MGRVIAMPSPFDQGIKSSRYIGLKDDTDTFAAHSIGVRKANPAKMPKPETAAYSVLGFREKIPYFVVRDRFDNNTKPPSTASQRRRQSRKGRAGSASLKLAT